MYIPTFSNLFEMTMLLKFPKIFTATFYYFLNFKISHARFYIHQEMGRNIDSIVLEFLSCFSKFLKIFPFTKYFEVNITIYFKGQYSQIFKSLYVFHISENIFFGVFTQSHTTHTITKKTPVLISVYPFTNALKLINTHLQFFLNFCKYFFFHILLFS